MKKLALLALVPLALALTGCAVPPLDFTPADIEFSTEKVEAELRSVNVSYAKKEEQTGEIYVGVTPQTSEGDNFISAFKDALQSGIDQAGLFRDGAPMKVTVFAKIRKFESPHMSVGFGTTSEVEYTIMDRETGRPIFRESIESYAEVPFDTSLFGQARFMAARNASGQANIRDFIAAVRKSGLVRAK